jgi:HNH endonuclease
MNGAFCVSRNIDTFARIIVMAPTFKTQVMLWGRAAHRCALPECRIELVSDPTETDDESLIGEVCHIVAQSNAGPRGDPSFSPSQRDKYANLILLCRNHHKIVDDQSSAFTVERLREIKAIHELWVNSSLEGFDPAEQRDREVYASYVEEFVKRTDLDNWKNWSSGVFSSGYQHISKERFEELRGLKGWIFSRVWPQRISALEDAFNNFMYILQDFEITFAKYSKGRNDDTLYTERFYKIQEYDPERYNYLSSKYDFYVELVEDLMLELTRAANYICDLVRKHLDPSFRLAEGVLIIDAGLYMDMSYHSLRAEYRSIERGPTPYPGLSEFKKVRATRDHYMGVGYGPDGPENEKGIIS